MQTLINIANVIAPFAVCLFILYIACGWVLVYFKRYTMVKKYFIDSFEGHYLSVIWFTFAVMLLIFQLLVPLNPNELSPLGFMFLMSSGVTILIFIVVKIINALIAFRDKIHPE